MSSDKKLLTIFGATGNQGGSVIATILANPSLSSQFALRAITRDPTKPNAQALASQGVSLAKANLDDPASIATAVAGSHGVFGLTDYWASTSKTVEETQGRNIVDACLAAGVHHLVWSSLPNATDLTDGVLTKVEHFDSKAAVAAYAQTHKGSMAVSNFMPGYFMSNLLTQIKRGADGTPTLSLPWHPDNTWLPLLDIRSDTGKFVAGLFAAGATADGVSVQGASEWVHPSDIVRVVSKLAGQQVVFKEVPMTVEKAAKLDRIPEELMQNMMLVRDYSYFGKGAQERQAESDRWLAEGEGKTGWEDFAARQKWAF